MQYGTNRTFALRVDRDCAARVLYPGRWYDAERMAWVLVVTPNGDEARQLTPDDRDNHPPSLLRYRFPPTQRCLRAVIAAQNADGAHR